MTEKSQVFSTRSYVYLQRYTQICGKAPPRSLLGLTKEDDDEFEYVSKNENFGQYWQYWHVRRKPIGDQQSTISAPTRSHIPEGVNILQWKIFHWGTIFPRQKYCTGEKYSTGKDISQGKIIS